MNNEEKIKAKAVKMFKLIKQNPVLLTYVTQQGLEGWLEYWKVIFKQKNYEAKEQDFEELEKIYEYMMNYLVDEVLL